MVKLVRYRSPDPLNGERLQAEIETALGYELPGIFPVSVVGDVDAGEKREVQVALPDDADRRVVAKAVRAHKG